MRFRHSIKIQRLNFDTRREGIHGERREIDWTVCRSLSQWAHFGSFKRLDQPEIPLAHRINDFRLRLGKQSRKNVKGLPELAIKRELF